MEIKRINILSAVKIGGALHAGLGLIVGLFIGLFMLLGGAAANASGQEDSALAEIMGMGIGIVIASPIIYGLAGAFMWFLMSLIYNMVASFVGGIEFEVK
jgi:hypothetical protein